MQHDLFAVVALLQEHFVRPWRILQAHVVGNHEARVQLAFFDKRQKRLNAALYVALARSQRKTAIDDGAHRELVNQSSVYAND